jgi:hypothetical protein
MPVGFNSPARNLFLLGSTGAQVVTNFFRRIDQSAGTDGVYLPDEIRYNVPDQKFLLAGSNETASSKGKGWFEKRSDDGTLDWKVEIESTLNSTNTTLTALDLDSSNNLIVCGKTGTRAWVAKYSNGGDISWQVASNTAGLGYTGIAVDNSNNIYVCGSSLNRGYLEKIHGDGFGGIPNTTDISGAFFWGKDSRSTYGPVTFVKCDTNSRGQVVVVGKVSDTIKNKGYIAKVNATDGTLLWERTIEDPRLATSSSYWQTECTDVYIDSKDQIYVVGTIRDTIGNKSRGFLIKYSPEGNIVWQKETKLDRNFEFYGVKSDGETQQTIVAGRFTYNNDDFVLLNKYSQDGTLLWTRTLYSSLDQTIGNVSLDADPSFFYLLFTDEATNVVTGEPDTYTFGKVSTSGNGFGAFQYSSGGTNYDYTILNITDNIGRLSDGSVRQDTSDLVTYPFGANKILFDDLATQVANKKVQVNEINTFSGLNYVPNGQVAKITTSSGIITDQLVLYFEPSISYPSPRNRNVIYDISGVGHTGSIFNTPSYSSSNGGYLTLNGTNQYITVPTNGAWGFGANGTVEMWVYILSNPGTNRRLFSVNNNTSSLDAYLNGATNNIYFHGSSAGTSNPINSNIWVHIVVRYLAGALTVYVNNAAVAMTGTTTGYNITNTGTLYIASFNTAGYELNARLGSFRLYSKGLSAVEVSQNFNATRAKYGV